MCMINTPKGILYRPPCLDLGSTQFHSHWRRQSPAGRRNLHHTSGSWSRSLSRFGSFCCIRHTLMGLLHNSQLGIVWHTFLASASSSCSNKSSNMGGYQPISNSCNFQRHSWRNSLCFHKMCLDIYLGRSVGGTNNFPRTFRIALRSCIKHNCLDNWNILTPLLESKPVGTQRHKSSIAYNSPRCRLCKGLRMSRWGKCQDSESKLAASKGLLFRNNHFRILQTSTSCLSKVQMRCRSGNSWG